MHTKRLVNSQQKETRTKHRNETIQEMVERIRKKKTTQDDFKHWEGYIMPKDHEKRQILP